MQIVLYAVTLLRKPLGGCLDVNASATSQTPENFNAHPAMHPLKDIICHVCRGAMCINLILHFLEEPKLRQSPADTKGMDLLNIPYYTEVT